MVGAFPLITPTSVALRVRVLVYLNRRDLNTIAAIGSLEASSVGAVAWISIVEVLAREWVHEKSLHTSVV